ncbi:hypothetical protein MBLNU459_g2390t1 [Dothideomycetes sp. NU459]
MRFVSFIGNPAVGGVEEGALLVLATALIYTLLAVFQTWYWQSVARFQTKLRGCLITSIHDKALRSRPDEKSSPLMLMTVDVDKVVTGLRSMHEYWSTLFAIGLALGLLYIEVGVIFLAPLVLMVILVAISTTNGTSVAPKQKTWLAATQTRVSYVTGVISALKNIKLLGIGPSVLKRGNEMRQKEVNARSRIFKALMINFFISQTTFSLSCLVLFSGIAIQTRNGGDPLTSTRLFTCLSILKLFTSPMMSTVQYISQTLQSFAALQRIQSYLVRDDHVDQRRLQSGYGIIRQNQKTGFSVANEQAIVSVVDVTCGYSGRAVLAGLNCQFERGSLNMVIGSVGSGKSTLLKSLLGEAQITRGTVEVDAGSIAFCDQMPWLWNASIADNIIGINPYDEAWLSRVTWSCGLHEDFKQLSSGIHTLVGSDGAALSGGQKNRISLARAIYSRNRFLILDDILSGLDNHTEKLVFHRIFNGLLKELGSTVVLATHSIGWLRFADSVLIMDDGTISFQGPPRHMPTVHGIPGQSPKAPSPEDDLSEMNDLVSVGPLVNEDLATAPNNLSRSSDLGVYKTLLKSHGLLATGIWVIMNAVTIGLNTMQTVELKWWAASQATSPHEIGVYAGSFAAISVATAIASLILFIYSLLYYMPRSCIYLHAMQWKALLKVSFPSWGDKEMGNVTNRFSSDIVIVDMQLGPALFNTLYSIIDAVASTGILIVATPYIGASIPLVLGVFWVIQAIYLKTSKQLRLMDLEAKAPLCTHFLETVSGTVTIKAFGWTDAYREKNAVLLENSQTPYYLMESVQQWLSLVLNLVVAGLATVVMIIAVKLRDSVDAGYLGLAMLSIMDLGMYLELMVTSWTTLETSLGAITRMRAFMDSMPPEEEGSIVPPPDWLASGGVSIKNLTASYSETAETILKDVSLAISPGEKVAICGRTGSGKSSLASALFGLLHVRSGSIEMDDVNIMKVCQDTLRRKMIALPQDTFFSPGTVRHNLALREEETPDSLMLKTLERVGLKDKFEALAASSGGSWPTALDVELNPAEMLTKGQTQLFAMARAMLQQGQIVLIDEATSGLDVASEALVQTLLREAFAGRTIIAIAHHLRTIMDFDKVIVLDGGKIVEIGPPSVLKDTQGSLFGALLEAGQHD